MNPSPSSPAAAPAHDKAAAEIDRMLSRSFGLNGFALQRVPAIAAIIARHFPEAAPHPAPSGPLPATRGPAPETVRGLVRIVREWSDCGHNEDTIAGAIEQYLSRCPLESPQSPVEPPLPALPVSDTPATPEALGVDSTAMPATSRTPWTDRHEINANLDEHSAYVVNADDCRQFELAHTAAMQQARQALEQIAAQCPHVKERAEGGISDYGGNADDMARDYADTAASDIGDIARAALAVLTPQDQPAGGEEQA